MPSLFQTSNRSWLRSAVLLLTLVVTGTVLAAWKHASIRRADAAAATQPEPMASITSAVAQQRLYRPTATAIGTVPALNSITLRNELPGTVHEVMLTPLQGVDAAANVDFTVAQDVASALRPGQAVAVYAAEDEHPIEARIVAVDARIDPLTRNALVRARIPRRAPAPGASVRVEVPVAPPTSVVAVPVSALRKGPGGDHVFLIAPDSSGKPRVHDQPVQIGTIVGDEIVILSGLTPGQRVATSGSFKLREAVLVASDSSR